MDNLSDIPTRQKRDFLRYLKMSKKPENHEDRNKNGGETFVETDGMFDNLRTFAEVALSLSERNHNGENTNYSDRKDAEDAVRSPGVLNGHQATRETPLLSNGTHAPLNKYHRFKESSEEPRPSTSWQSDNSAQNIRRRIPRCPEDPKPSTSWQYGYAAQQEDASSTPLGSFKTKVVNDSSHSEKKPFTRRSRIKPIIDVKKVQEERERKKANAQAKHAMDSVNFKKPTVYICQRCNQLFFHVIAFKNHISRLRKRKVCYKRRR